jgi:hypothetical protein
MVCEWSRVDLDVDVELTKVLCRVEEVKLISLMS